MVSRGRLICCLLLLLALLTPGAGAAQFRVPLLDSVASAFASRPVTVICASELEDAIFDYAWGYVELPLDEQTEAHVHDVACVGALAIDLDVPGVTDFHKAIGAAVLVHEAYHLRRLPGNGSEARTECRAMRHYDIVLAKLGAEQATMDRLMPLMLLIHWQLGAIAPTYNSPRCSMPRRYDRYLGYPPR